jgi:uncharacterized membrane protein YeaQ/YmgE (transglycosylase-associated protein family)
MLIGPDQVEGRREVSRTSSSWLIDVLIGLIVAGVLAPATMALPERWQGAGTLWTLTLVCVAGALVAHYLLTQPDKPGN